MREFDEVTNVRIVKPVGIVFAEYYFYLIAYQMKVDFAFPTFIESIESNTLSKRLSHLKYRIKSGFKKGNFENGCNSCIVSRREIPFTGPSPQALLDQLPTDKKITTTDIGIIIEAGVFGKLIKI